MSKTTEQILKEFGDDTVKIIQSNMEKAGQNATGKTSDNIKSNMPNPNRVQVTAPSYVETLETGRGPAKSGTSTGDFQKNLEQWIKAKGINLSLGDTIQKQARSLRYLINKRGTELFRKGGRKDIITPIYDQKRIDELNRNIAIAELNKVANVIQGAING